MIYQIKKFIESKYNIDSFKDIVKSLNLEGGKAPRGMKDIYTSLVRIKSLYASLEQWGNNEMFISQLGNEISRHTDREWDEIVNKLTIFSQQTSELDLKNAIYLNKSTMSEKRFIKLSNDMDSFLSTLKGIHRDALQVGKKISIIFVKASEMKAKGKYVSSDNAFKIRADRVDFSQEGYASFPYILVHELGHRYLDYNKRTPNFNSPRWYTTPYSKTDSWSEEETFAELFGLSNWVNDYPEYKDKLIKFLNLLT